MSTTVLALADGSAVILVASILILIAMVYGLFSRTGSGITQRPYGKVYQAAPGARRASAASGRDDDQLRAMTRGTR